MINSTILTIKKIFQSQAIDFFQRNLNNMEILVDLANEKFRGPPIARSTAAVHRPSHHNEHVSNLWCTVVVRCGSAHSHSRARPWFMPLVKQPLEATDPAEKLFRTSIPRETHRFAVHRTHIFLLDYPATTQFPFSLCSSRIFTNWTSLFFVNFYK